jgi:nucleoside permease NupC
MDFIQLMKEKKKNDIIAFSVLSLIIFVAAIVYYMNEYHDSFTDNLLRLLKME